MMKKSILTGLACAALLWPLATGCSEEAVLTGNDSGLVSLSVDFRSEPLTASRASSTAPITASQLKLRLSPTSGKGQTYEWESADEFTEPKEVVTGTYLLEGYYGTTTSEGTGEPYYYGSTELKVLTGRETQADLTVTLANSIVKVVYTDALREYMSAYGAKVLSSTGASFDYDETIHSTDDAAQWLYVVPGEVSIDIAVTKPNGVSGTLRAATFEAKARKRHTVTVDIAGGAGKSELDITVTDDVDEADEYTVDLSDEILMAPAPVMTAEGFTDGETFFVVEGTKASAAPKINVVARGKIGSVKLLTASDALKAKGWPESVDLTNPGDAKAVLTQMGLTTLGIWNNPDVMGVIDFKGVIANIPYIENGAHTTTFTLSVTDRNGMVSEPETLTFTVDIDKLRLAIAEGTLLDATQIEARVDYNGSSINDVTFKARNTRGTLSAMTVNSTAYDAASKMYTVILGIPADVDITSPVTIQAEATGVTSEPAVVKVPTLSINQSAINAFATNAKVSATYNGEGAAPTDALYFELSTDGGNTWTTANAATTAKSRGTDMGAKTLTGLTPGTTYMVKAVAGDEISLPVSFTTEAAAQLPNGDCETAPTKVNTGNYWEEYSFAGGWGTNNPMTTSQGAAYAYCRISSTKPATGASGQGVQIRTNGWGSGNSALSGVSGACKYIDAGLYHLGDNRTTRPSGFSDRSGSLDTSDLNCGIEFGSRPASLSFAYKYEAKNSADHGEALIRVYDAAGNVIAEGKQNISAQGSFTTMTIPLNYTTSVKAAKIYVRFLSTNVSSALTKDGNWLNGPGWGNLSRGEYSGSTLTIDDITLNY